MKNYWVKDISKTDFVDELTKAMNLSNDQVAEIDAFIANTTMKYYVVFENNKISTFLTYDGNKCTRMSDMALSSSVYNSSADTNLHRFVGVHPETNEVLGIKEFTENFGTGILYSGTDAVSGFTFSSTDVTLEVADPGGVGGPPNPALGPICCGACAWVHSQLGLEFVNCLCCAGTCEFSCYRGPWL